MAEEKQTVDDILKELNAIGSGPMSDEQRELLKKINSMQVDRNLGAMASNPSYMAQQIRMAQGLMPRGMAFTGGLPFRPNKTAETIGGIGDILNAFAGARKSFREARRKSKGAGDDSLVNNALNLDPLNPGPSSNEITSADVPFMDWLA
jgi:hypothetical protein